MKKLFAMILTLTLVAGATALPASAAGYDGAEGTGTGKVEITTADNPIIIDPENPDPEDPNPPEELKNLVKLINQDIVFETTALSKAKNRGHDNPIPQQTVSGVMERVGVGVNDQTAYLKNENKWNLTVSMGDFFLVNDAGTTTTSRAMPGFNIELVSGGTTGVVSSSSDHKPSAVNLLVSTSNALDYSKSPRKVMTANATHGSPGHWVGNWDAKLLTGKTVYGGKSVADMTWTVSVGL